MLAGDVTAVEVNEARARELEETARRLGASNVRVVVADGRALPAELAGFDRALVDAPCSGLGVLNRRPDLRWRAEPLPELQLELLHAAAERVRPGRHDRVLGLHDQRRRVGGRRRRVGARSRREPRRRVAAVPARAPTRVPADAPARPRNSRVLRRAPHRALRIRRASSTCSLEPSARARPRPRRGCGRRPSRGRARGRGRGSRATSSQRRDASSALRRSPLASSSRSPTSGFGSMTSHGSRSAREHVPAVEVLVHEPGRRSVDRAVDVERGVEQRALERLDPPPRTGAARLRPSGRPRRRGARRDGSLRPRPGAAAASPATTVASSTSASQSRVPGTQRSTSSARRASSRATSRTAPRPSQRSSASASRVAPRRATARSA